MKCFMMASELKMNEVMYLPMSNDFLGFKDEFHYYKGLLLMNYCETQLTQKELKWILEGYTFGHIIEDRTTNKKLEYIEPWNVRRKINVKRCKRHMIVSTNRNGFDYLANGCEYYHDWGDSDEYNKLFSHIHYDNDDITHRSIGITMMYFQNINNQIQLKEQK